MNPIVKTGGFTLSAAMVEPYVAWGFHGFPISQMPPDTYFAVAAVLVTATHAIWNGFSAWWASREPVALKAMETTTVKASA